MVGQVGHSLSHALAGEAGDGECGVDEAPLGEFEVDWVFEDEEVEEGDLADLVDAKLV